MQPIGVFGGTFDPIHCGHLRTAFELWQELGLAEVRFLPTGSPPHRAELYASAELRLRMVQAAVADQPGFVLGMDAFLGLPNWHRWRELLALAHVIVAHRPGWRAPTTGPLGEVMVDHGTGSIRVLHEERAGRVYVRAVTQLEISSTELRALIVAGRDPRYLVPDAVRQIILETRCYAAQQGP